MTRVGLTGSILGVVAALVAAGCSADVEVRSADNEIEWTKATERVGDTLRVCGPVAGVGTEGDDTFINLGADHPSANRFVIVVWDDANFTPPAGQHRACASGEITTFEGVPQLEIRDADDVDFTPAPSGRGATSDHPADGFADGHPLWIECEQELLPAVNRYFDEEEFSGEMLEALRGVLIRAAEDGDIDTATLTIGALGALTYLAERPPKADIRRALKDLDAGLIAIYNACEALKRSNRISERYRN